MPNPKIAMIVCVDRRLAIGRDGDQLIYISADLKHFKEKTIGHTIIMGRKTSDALPKGTLPKRRNIVLTRQAGWHRDGAEVAPSVEAAIEMCRTDEMAIVIGGAEVYRAFMPMAQILYVTHIDHEFPEADTFFPAIDPSVWRLTSESEPMVDEKSGIAFRFAEYERL